MIIQKTGFFAEPFPVNQSKDARKVGEFSIDDSLYPTLVDVSDGFEEDFYHAGVMSDYKVYTTEVEPIAPDTVVNLRDILQNDVNEKYYKIDVAKWEYMKGAKKELRTRKDGSTYHYAEGAIPFPDILDRPGRTMLTSEGSVNRSSHLIEDPQTRRLRVLTPVECERLNGFPDNWTDTGMSERQRYFTMGNALVVPLIERMGKRLNGIIG